MVPELQKISDLIDSITSLDEQQRAALAGLLKKADKEFSILDFKFQRTEKSKRTMSNLLEQTIEDVEQKRRALELQNRVLEIEATLERVRATTMAMHKSEELLQTSQVLFDQFNQLGYRADQLTIGIFKEDDEVVEIYATINGQQLPNIFRHPIHEPYVMNKMYEAWKAGKTSFVLELGANELKLYNRFRNELVGTEMFVTDIPAHQKRVITAYYFSRGMIAFGDSEQPPPETSDILNRFAKVFEQTYTRFLDLQKAEAQAREAQIEAALERVRTVAMGMRKPADMLDVCHIISDQLQLLGVQDIRNVQTIIIYQAKYQYINYQYFAPYDKNSIEEIDYRLHPVELELTEKMLSSREAFYYKKFEGQELQIWRDHRRETHQLPDPRLDQVDAAYYYFYSIGNGALGITAYSPLSEDALDVFKRFRNVFQLAYKRYIDIELATAQAREAQIEAALERVRGRAMAMHNSQDLAETIGVFYKELQTFSLTPTRCGVGLIDKEEQIAETFTWQTTDTGEKLESVGRLKMDAHPILKSVYEHWQLQTEYHLVLRGNDIKDYYNVIRPQASVHDYTDAVQYGYFFVFNEGAVHAWTESEMKEEELQIYRRFTSVLSLTYKRYKDLQTAEANALQAQQDLIEIKAARQKAEDALSKLQATQKQLIQSEKMASLGELTAGIAHEIQNPLNFVNNFSEVSVELVDDLTEELAHGNQNEVITIGGHLKENLNKISEHGKRAASIVKGMLQHSRKSTDKKEPTDINALVDEYVRLSYHGMRAKDKTFNATIETAFDQNAGSAEVIPQEIGRVLLNLLNNAFYSVNEKKKRWNSTFESVVTVTTKKVDGKIVIAIKDNGTGIPEKVLEKIYQPFFTTKPTGEGTGLGLSLSYDIITKGHGGEMKVETENGRGAEFIIQLPVTENA